MTNYGTLAILALPRMPERRLRFLLALETFGRDEGGWREAGTELLAAKANLSPRTAAKARGELAAAGLIDYRRGDGRGHNSTYRIRAPGVADHDLKVAREVATFKGGKNAATFPGPKGGRSDPVKVAIEPGKGGKRNPLTSGNAFGGLEPSGLEPSGASSARHKASERTRRGGAVVNGSEEGHPGAAPDPAENGRARLPGPEAENIIQDQDLGDEDERRGKGKGQCADCGRWLPIIGDGAVKIHDSRLLGLGGACPGSGRQPVEPVRCVVCGEGRKAIGGTGECSHCAAKRRAARKAAEIAEADARLAARRAEWEAQHRDGGN